MTATRIATRDASMRAVVRRETPLHFTDPMHAGSPHVRAASSLARVPGGIAVIQDDASVIAIHDVLLGATRSIRLPHEVDGAWLFDKEQGNKKHKLDLEACVAVDSPDPSSSMLLVFGSGSKRRRESVVLISEWTTAAPSVHIVQASALYALLRATRGFAGTELNIEGAIRVRDRLRLFGRGNGARVGDDVPVNATCDLDWRTLLAYLRDADSVAPPHPSHITQYDLGALDGVPLGFTDAALLSNDGAVLYSAAAEASPDAVRDGRVVGSAIGIIDDGSARWTQLVAADGTEYRGKVEGVLPPLSGDDVLRVVVDPDDHRVPALLCEVELTHSTTSPTRSAMTTPLSR
jgi:hypothetical protein